MAMLVLPFSDYETGGLGFFHMKKRIAGQPAPRRKVVNGGSAVGDNLDDRSHRQRPQCPNEANQQIGASRLAGLEVVIGMRLLTSERSRLHIDLPRRM
jgi:hypothetical protein